MPCCLAPAPSFCASSPRVLASSFTSTLLKIDELSRCPPNSLISGPFHRSDNKPNGSHHRATHWRCINAERPSTAPIDIDLEDGDWELMAKEQWCNKKSVNVEKAEEKALAVRFVPTKKEKQELEKKRKQGGREEADVNADDEGAGGSGGRKKRKLVKAVETSFSQSKLQVYRGLDIPFSEDHTQAIAQQTLRATQSANLPERWTSDPEVHEALHDVSFVQAQVPPTTRYMLTIQFRFGRCFKSIKQFSPKFAQQLLHLVVNQAGQERWFSDFSNKKEQEAQSIEPQKNGPSPTGEGYALHWSRTEGRRPHR
ncbi:hypothetical protein R3P38DRAFT_3296771 [Favolaschia claudopus]|uniref:Uncharacterized protein n=1 Tax=Favolaschia claudopus TaxID=2862362 RepID=A0AAV9Z926_9AGAR